MKNEIRKWIYFFKVFLFHFDSDEFCFIWNLSHVLVNFNFFIFFIFIILSFKMNLNCSNGGGGGAVVEKIFLLTSKRNLSVFIFPSFSLFSWWVQTSSLPLSTKSRHTKVFHSKWHYRICCKTTEAQYAWLQIQNHFLGVYFQWRTKKSSHSAWSGYGKNWEQTRIFSSFFLWFFFSKNNHQELFFFFFYLASCSINFATKIFFFRCCSSSHSKYSRNNNHKYLRSLEWAKREREEKCTHDICVFYMHIASFSWVVKF